MDNIFEIVVSVLFALVGWFGNVFWTALTDLQKSDRELTAKVNSIQLLVVGDYIRKEDMTVFKEEVMRKLDKVLDKLDTKADK